jgi:hypothetical protein
MPTSPISAAQRDRMRPGSLLCLWDLLVGSRSHSPSNENRGHSEENEQHAPQVRHSKAISSAGPRRQNGHLILRLTADSFPRLLSISYSTVWPSFSELRPARSTAEMWTNTSLPPPPEG